mmetsp:Transcript_33302/g.80864  ORF Transcript_33302/g.80864 Transcript_33302/m.80864 type:complete len:300 (+) Transcript_33302:1554-2453(+)
MVGMLYHRVEGQPLHREATRSPLCHLAELGNDTVLVSEVKPVLHSQGHVRPPPFERAPQGRKHRVDHLVADKALLPQGIALGGQRIRFHNNPPQRRSEEVDVHQRGVDLLFLLEVPQFLEDVNRLGVPHPFRAKADHPIGFVVLGLDVLKRSILRRPLLAQELRLLLIERRLDSRVPVQAAILRVAFGLRALFCFVAPGLGVLEDVELQIFLHLSKLSLEWLHRDRRPGSPCAGVLVRGDVRFAPPAEGWIRSLRVPALATSADTAYFLFALAVFSPHYALAVLAPVLRALSLPFSCGR